ncbi:hypothetical protein KORDIASMS9_02543 [Kordia sp. SMS9]|uniref:hypothetical protein n=1 Tax=Kordia sp. SMS9 TaxID=2282170 RepID=UPI000E0D8B2C|nr:hypothetical protein [Kordia sp. SMS9]AXG70304.1 hypothetical protein KORDIASMS9_02543 [Kordia sp. SMS9]
MKKLLFTTVLLGILSACNVDDVESDLITATTENTTQQQDICTPDPTNPPTILGSTWIRTSVMIETPIDGNGDGVFSNELLAEVNCDGVILFRDNFKASNPVYDNFFLSVIDDGNGNLSQQISCGIGDGLLPTYTQEGNTIRFCYSGTVEFTATLSNNEQTMTFVFPSQSVFFSFNEILRTDGTVESYQGNVTMIYTRQ